MARHPEALYIVWGKTHPVVREQTGEVYRQNLIGRVERLGLDRHVKFVERLLTQEEVIQSLAMSDIKRYASLFRDVMASSRMRLPSAT